MIHPLELFIGLSYTRAKRRTEFISFISLASMLGTALGVAALITVLSVMNGFGEELRSRILSVAAHVTVTGFGGELTDWQSVQRQVVTDKGVVGSAPYVLAQGLLTQKGKSSGVMVRGILPAEESTVSSLGENMKGGKIEQLAAGKYRIILGQELAWSLGVWVGDKVTLMAPQVSVTAAGILPRMKRFVVAGVFEAGMYEYDSGLVLIHMADAQKLYRLGKNVTGLRLKLDDIDAAPLFSQELDKQLGARYRIKNWTQEHVSFFRALKIERNVMFVILMLIVAVAAFNLVSTLVMVVTDKQADIAILRTLGMSPANIMSVFIYQGMIIGLIGTLLGLLGGIVLAMNVSAIVSAIEGFFQVQFMPPDLYYISSFPSRLDWNDVATIGVLSFVLSVLATLYPAWRASRTLPAEALRYE
ncbi:MAG TPA: lipoprotein-releasing ABC transporter permease subunit [Gammaproteobacteria bacterium]|nr:lipoprotein-releasing system transmembrane protein LolE [bacterium BMS3Abin11]GMT40950.1 MAG: lipoprotein releasing system protein [bacterium]HDH16254.1 lipoprotein-releasing ABC transporter permease subunit [Gammaproteobacteria bacterium]HDZ77907.1 lipoprotein-releasing ABC transporter permease subunit [Gammaproteobacteria bacterium]